MIKNILKIVEENKDTKIFLDRFKKYDKRKKIIYFKNRNQI